MKKITIITKHSFVDIKSISQSRKERIITICRKLIKRGIDDLKIESLGAQVFIRDGNIIVTTRESQYACRLEGKGEIYYSNLDESNLQKLGDSDESYEYIKALEEVILRTSNKAIWGP